MPFPDIKQARPDKGALARPGDHSPPRQRRFFVPRDKENSCSYSEACRRDSTRENSGGERGDFNRNPGCDRTPAIVRRPVGGASSRRETRENGGARRNRTADLVIANDALSQLSYGPEITGWRAYKRPCRALSSMAVRSICSRALAKGGTDRYICLQQLGGSPWVLISFGCLARLFLFTSL